MRLPLVGVFKSQTLNGSHRSLPAMRQAFALKTVDSHNTSRGDLVRIHNQVKIMTSLSHPHIVAFVEVFETPRCARCE